MNAVVAGGEINLISRRLLDRETACKRQFELALERIEEEVRQLRQQFDQGLVPSIPIDLVSSSGKAFGSLMVWQNTRELRKTLPDQGENALISTPQEARI